MQDSIIRPTRRGFLLGLLAAPVIVRAASIMPVKVAPHEVWELTGNMTLIAPDWVRQFRIELFERAAAMTDVPDAYLGARLAT